jgi:hypothetical protein
VHLDGGLKLLDASYDQIALPTARQSGEFDFKPKPVLFEPLLECVGLRTFSYSHQELSVAAGPGCWPNDRSAR